MDFYIYHHKKNSIHFSLTNFYFITFKDITVNSKCYVIESFYEAGSDNVLEQDINISNIRITCEYWAADGTIK